MSSWSSNKIFSEEITRNCDKIKCLKDEWAHDEDLRSYLRKLWMQALLLLHRQLQHLQQVEKILTECSRSYYPFPAVSPCLFFHQSIPVALGVPGVTRSERMCKHNKSKKLTKNQAEILSNTQPCEFFVSSSSTGIITAVQKLEQSFFLSKKTFWCTLSPNFSVNRFSASANRGLVIIGHGVKIPTCTTKVIKIILM